MKRTHDTFGDEWRCDGERFCFYIGLDSGVGFRHMKDEIGPEWSNWYTGDFTAAENYMHSMGCAPEVIVWEVIETQETNLSQGA